MAEPFRLGILGFTRTAEALLRLLSNESELSIRLADIQRGVVAIEGGFVAIQAIGTDSVADFVRNHDFIIVDTTFPITRKAIEAAGQHGVAFLDMSADRRVSTLVGQLGNNAMVISSCGIEPGLVQCMARHIMQTIDTPMQIDVRFGHLPLYPSGRIRHHRSNGIDALMDRYCGICDIIWNGQRLRIPALSDTERFSISGINYEAFSVATSSDLFTSEIPSSVRDYSFKMIAHTGHSESIKLLLEDLSLKEDRVTLSGLLDRSFRYTFHDCIIISISIYSEFQQENYTTTLYGKDIAGSAFSAFESVHAGLAATVIDLYRDGKLPTSIVPFETIPLTELLTSKYSKLFA